MRKLLKYQLSTAWIPFLIFILSYLVMLGLGNTVMLTASGDVAVSINGVEMAACIICFVLFVSSYGEHLRFAMQNSGTRRMHFRATVCNLVISSACLAAVVQGFVLLGGAAPRHSELAVQSMVSLVYGRASGIAEGAVWSFTLLLAAGMFGVLLAVIFARLGKYGRIILAAGVPIFCFLLLPMLIGFLYTKAPALMQSGFAWLLKVLGIASGNPYMGSLTFLVVAGVLGAVSFLVNRRMELK